MVAAIEKVLLPAERAADLTGKLLAFARKGQYRPEPLDVHDLVDEVVGILARSIHRTIVIERELAAERCVVRGDAAALQSAILNLALNARDAMPDGGTLTFATEAAGDRLRLIVRDTGAGLEAGMEEHIFKPFFTTKAVGQGTGMGLAAVYGTAKAMGGEVSVSSEPGQGCTFVLDLPLSDEPVAAAPPEAPPVDRRAAHVLLIDDEETVRDATGHGLRGLGYRVTACIDGPEGIAAFREDPAAVDLVLPGAGGDEVFAALKELDPAVKVLIISGYGADETVQGLLDAGALGFLKKPVRIRALGEAVAAALAG